MTETTALVEPRECPYFGLDYYKERFGSWFFGRAADGDRIITNLLAARLTLLHAESGVGKSSLLRAGVAWRLRRQAHVGSPSSGAVIDLPVVFTSWKDDPLPALINKIRKTTQPFLAGRPAPDLPSDRLDEAIEAAAEAVDASLLVILDQFEEYFLYSSSEPTPGRFADELARCINRADVPANFLISIREDSYAALGDLFKGRVANVYGNYLHIDHLDRESAEQAIRAPLEVYNRQPGIATPVTIQDKLVDEVLDQLTAHDTDDEPGQGRASANGGGRIETPLLQLVMETVWKRELSRGSHKLRYSTLQRQEGVKKIVDTHLEEALGALDKGEQETAVDVFEWLVTPSDSKIAESVPDLAHRTGHSEKKVGGVLDKLDRERIVRPVPAAPGRDPTQFRRYEIFHDVLAPAINREIAARDEQRRAQRLRRLTALIVGVLVVALVLGGFFFYLWTTASNAVTASQIATSRELAAVADADLAQNPESSVVLALHALSFYTTGQAEQMLRTALADVQEIRTFRNGTAVTGAAFNPANANEVASAGQDGSAWIWNVRTGRPLVRLALLGASGAATFAGADSVAFNQAGSQVAVGYQDGTVAVFDARSGRVLHETNVRFVVHDARFIGGSGALIVATQGGAGLWRPAAGPGFQRLSAEPANTIAVDPRDDLEFAVATGSGTRLWNLRKSLRPVRPGGLRLPSASGLTNNDAEFSPGGTQVVTAGSDGLVRVYDAATATLAATLYAGQGRADSAAFSPDGKLIVAGYSSGATIVWDAVTHIQQTQVAGNQSAVFTARFSGNSREVVTASGDGAVRVSDALPSELRRAFVTSFRFGAPSPVFAAQYSPDGSRILVVDGSGRAYVVAGNGKPLAAIHPPGTDVSVVSAKFSRSGREIVTADSDGTVDLWRATGSGSLRQVTLRSSIRLPGPAQYATFSPLGRRIVAVTSSDTAEVFSARTGRLLHTLDPHSVYPLSVAAFSPDGRQILTGDLNGQVQVWDAATGAELRVLGKEGQGIKDVEFDRTGREFVTASTSGAVTIWSSSGYRKLHAFTTCLSPSTASFRPNGQQVVVGCPDGTIAVFDATGQQVLSMSGPGTVNSAAFSPDGNSIVTTFAVADTGGVRIWSSQLATSTLRALKSLARLRIAHNGTPRLGGLLGG